MKRILCTSFAFFMALCGTCYAQTTLNYEAPLPVDKSIKKGVLSNGMTYYLKSTDVVKDAATYYIIQNVGSILENEDQRGLAHFLEHMAFNGTKNFPGKGILNTLQKHGAIFGRDINAYTSFDETVYNLTNIPTKDGLVDTCLTVLKDWSNYLLLTDEEIDAERGVIKEEWRTRQNGQMRLLEQTFPVVFNNSKYAERTPIGLMSVVEGFEYEKLRDFYHDWYRTDLQAIAVIGDINIEEIEQKIIAKFSSIPAVKNPKKRFHVSIPENDTLLYVMAQDPEVATASINYGIHHKNSLETETVGDLKKSLLEQLALSMLNARIGELSQDPTASFLGASLSYGGGWARPIKDFSMSVSPKKNQQQAAFKDVLTALMRAIKYGFTASEIDRAVVNFTTFYENQIAQKEDLGHASIEASIQANFLQNKTIIAIDQEYEIAKEILKNINPTEIQNTLKGLYTKKNRFISVTGVDGENNLTKKQAREIIEQVENDTTIAPYTEEIVGKTLLDGLDIKTGTITNTIEHKEIDATTFVLSNGIKVHYKFADKEKDNVSLDAISYGGTSLLTEEDLPSALIFENLVGMSGLGNYTAVDLQKVLAGKTAHASTSLGEIEESIGGFSNTKDVETMLQMVHLRFVKPRFDKEAYKVLENNIKYYLSIRSKDIGEKMKDSLTVTLYGKNNPLKPILTEDYAAKVSFSKVSTIYNTRFNNAGDFDFYIVGDVSKEQLIPLLEKYIASLPTTETKENYKFKEAKWLANHIKKDIYMAMEDPKAVVNIAYRKEMPFSLENLIYTRALGDILQLRITETVRESEGGAYSPNAGAYFVREPKALADLTVSFDCNPDIVDKLVAIVHEEINKIAKGSINKEDLHKTRTNFLKQRTQSKDYNGYDMELLINFFRYGYNMNDPKNFDHIVQNMSANDIKNIAAKIINGGKSYEVVFKPKQ